MNRYKENLFFSAVSNHQRVKRRGHLASELQPRKEGEWERSCIGPSASWQQVIAVDDTSWRDYCQPFIDSALDEAQANRTALSHALGHKKLCPFGLTPMAWFPDMGWGMGGRTVSSPIKLEIRQLLPAHVLKEMDRYEMKSATADSLAATLKLYQTGDKAPSALARVVMELVYGWLELEFREAMLTSGHPGSQAFNWGTGPGAILRKQGFRTKGDFNNWCNEVRNPIDVDFTGPHLVRAGARSRLRDIEARFATAEEAATKSGRLVWEVDYRDVYPAVRYSHFMVEWLTGHFALGSAIGMSSLGRDMHLASAFLGLMDERPYHVVCLDRKRYDSSVKRRHVARILWLWRLAFQETDESFDDIWLYFLRSLCGNTILLPNGGAYWQGQGISTGHPFVQIIETILTFVTTVTDYTTWFVERRGWSVDSALKFTLTNVRTLCLGDDQISVCMDGAGPPIDWFVACGKRDWGMGISLDKSWSGYSSCRPEVRKFQASPVGPYFLGVYLIGSSCWRSSHDLLIKLYHPEGVTGRLTDELFRLISYRLNWWENPIAVEFLEKLIGAVLGKMAELSASGHEIYDMSAWTSTNWKYEFPVLDLVNPDAIIGCINADWSSYYVADDPIDLKEVSRREWDHLVNNAL